MMKLNNPTVLVVHEINVVHKIYTICSLNSSAPPPPPHFFCLFSLSFRRVNTRHYLICPFIMQIRTLTRASIIASILT